MKDRDPSLLRELVNYMELGMVKKLKAVSLVSKQMQNITRFTRADRAHRVPELCTFNAPEPSLLTSVRQAACPALKLDGKHVVNEVVDAGQAVPSSRLAPKFLVTLNVYDVTSSVSIRRLNDVCRLLGTGAYHAAIQVHGKEWSYGGLEPSIFKGRNADTGVFSCEPRQCDMHHFREQIPLGHTRMTEAEVKELLVRLSKKWVGRRYDVFRNNCCHFSCAFAEELGVGAVPSWVQGLAEVGGKVGDTLDPAIKKIDTTINAGKERRGARGRAGSLVGDFARGIIASGEQESVKSSHKRKGSLLFLGDCVRGMGLFFCGQVD
jgi:hypothetical protein